MRFVFIVVCRLIGIFVLAFSCIAFCEILFMAKVDSMRVQFVVDPWINFIFGGIALLISLTAGFYLVRQAPSLAQTLVPDGASDSRPQGDPDLLLCTGIILVGLFTLVRLIPTTLGNVCLLFYPQEPYQELEWMASAGSVLGVILSLALIFRSRSIVRYIRKHETK